MNAAGVFFLIFICVSVGIVAGMVIHGERRACERQRLAAWHWRNWHWEQELLSTAQIRGCPSCELLRRRNELQTSPPE